MQYFFLSVALLVAVGCGQNQPLTAKQAIEHFSPDVQVDRSFVELDQYILNPEQHITAKKAALPYLTAMDDTQRYAAVYLFTLTATPTDNVALLPALSDTHDSIRVMAAGTLLGWGETAAIPVLIEALSSTATMQYSDPPLPLAQLAETGLMYYTEQPFTSAADWAVWWGQHKATIVWDANSLRYR